MYRRLLHKTMGCWKRAKKYAVDMNLFSWSNKHRQLMPFFFDTKSLKGKTFLRNRMIFLSMRSKASIKSFRRVLSVDITWARHWKFKRSDTQSKKVSFLPSFIFTRTNLTSICPETRAKFCKRFRSLRMTL